MQWMRVPDKWCLVLNSEKFLITQHEKMRGMIDAKTKTVRADGSQGLFNFKLLCTIHSQQNNTYSIQ